MRLALSLFFNQLRRGAFSLILSGLWLATCTVMIIALVGSAIDATLQERSTHLLAGDVQVRGSQSIPREWVQKANEFGLRTSTALAFRAMVFGQDSNQIFQVKAVDERYPLKGSVELANKNQAEGGPARGTLFAPKSLIYNLNTAVGEPVGIGRSDLKIAAELIREPDNLRGNFGLAPTLLMNLEDVPATAIVQPGSRVQATLYLAGSTTQLANFQQWLTPKLGDHYDWRTIDEASSGVFSALEKAEQFFFLGMTLSILLSGTAVGLGARKYAIDQLQPTALLKSLGLGPKATRRIYIAQLHLLAFIGIAPALLVGWFIYTIMQVWIIQVIPDLQPPPLSAYWIAALCVYFTLLAFAAPYFLRVHKVSPNAVLGQLSDQQMLNNRLALVLGFATLTLISVVFTGQIELVFYLALALIACFALTALVAYTLSISIKKITRQKPVWLHLGINNLFHHRHHNIPQIAMFSVLFTLVFSIILVRTSLINQWQQQLPENAPNYFIFNIFGTEKPQLETFLKNQNINTSPFYPMARARITHVDETPIDAILEHQEQSINYEREMNITWADAMGSDNRLVSGEFWSSDLSDALQASVEEAFAQGLDIQLGDTLRLSEQGQTINAIVTSIREVQWDSLNPNFFIILNKPLQADESANWLTSFNLPEQNQQAFYQWLKDHPTVTAIEVEQTILMIKEIIAQVSLAIEFIGLLVVIAGFLVFIASLQITLDIRTRENAIMRVFGADKALVRKIMLNEYLFIAVIACLIACIGSELCVYLLADKLFELHFVWHPLLWLAAPLLVLPGVTLTSLLATRKTVSQPPLSTLRSLS